MRTIFVTVINNLEIIIIIIPRVILMQFIFDKHNNYRCPNDFWKFGYDRIIKIEVI